MNKQEIFDFLVELRDSGEVNMWGAGEYLEVHFGLSRREAKAALLDWFESFNKQGAAQ